MNQNIKVIIQGGSIINDYLCFCNNSAMEVFCHKSNHMLNVVN